MPQSTLITSSPSSLKNNLQPPYELWSFFFLLSIQLQSWIWTSYIKTSFQLFLVIQSLQNVPLQMASSLRIQTVYLLLDNRIYVPSAGNLRTRVLQYNHDHILAGHFSQKKNTGISLPQILLASVLMYNNFASPVLLVCNPSHNITSPTDLSNNCLFLNNYRIPFLWTSLRNFYHPLGLTLS